jgi:two-component system response regulator DevR
MTPAMLSRLLPMVRRLPQEEGPKLSERELEVLGLLAEGLSNAAISERLFLSTHTVRNHVHAILSKLGAHSKLEAVSLAVRRGVIRYPISDG